MSSPKKPQPQKVNIEAKHAVDEKSHVKKAEMHLDLGPLMFDKINYQLMALGVIVILVGFALMSGGASTNPEIFDADEIYSFRRITLAPILVILGFVIEIYAIFKNKATA